MFNAEIKERFVKSYTTKNSVRASFKRFFDIAQKYEEQWGADLYTRTPNELSLFLNEASGLTTQSRSRTLRMLKSYVRWCLTQEDIFDVQEDLLDINSFSDNKLRKQTITSPVHLQRYLDAVFECEEKETVDNIYRTYFWMAYAGIDQNDVPKIRKKDMDFSDMVIRFGGKTYPIYREGIKAIRRCVELDYIQSIRTNTGKSIVLKRFDSDCVMRGRRSVFTSHALQERVSRKQKEAIEKGKTDLRLSYFKVWISGLFYKVYLDEISGIEPDFSSFIAEIDAAKGIKKDRSSLLKQVSSYHEDYLRWKELFSK